MFVAFVHSFGKRYEKKLKDAFFIIGQSCTLVQKWKMEIQTWNGL